MLCLRPISYADSAILQIMAEESGIGFTSLPNNSDILAKKIERAQEAFQEVVDRKQNQSYLFVLEDLEQNEVIGVCGIESAVGLDDAFYHYHLSKVVHVSRELDIRNEVEILSFCNDYTGRSEICTLFLRPHARRGTAGHLLSRARFLFMAQHQHRFSENVFAEMRGISDERGSSPFWEWLERHFFSIDFPTADYLTGIGKKVFIAELMPKYPIYVNLLSEAAQQSIGQVHAATRPALAMLKKEGFRYRNYVDIFDAGPTVEANIQDITSVKTALNRSITINDSISADSDVHDELWIIINHSIERFRAVVAPAMLNDHSVSVHSNVVAALGVDAGDAITATPLKRKTGIAHAA